VQVPILSFLLPKWVIFHPRDAELPIWVVYLFGGFGYFHLFCNHKSHYNVKQINRIEMKKKIIITALLVIDSLALLTSCTIVRGYKADGAYGPTSFSYQKQQKDTVVNRSDAFTFHRAAKQCDWIDTHHPAFAGYA